MTDTLKDGLDTLAAQLLGSATASDNDDFKLDCFKILSGFWISATKLSKKGDDEDDGDSPMAAVAARLKQAGAK